MTEIRLKEIVIISRCKHEQFLSAVLTNSQRPVVGCLNVGAGILARSERVSKGTGADKRFVKTALKNAELLLDDSKYFFFFYFCHIQLKAIEITKGCSLLKSKGF